MAFDLYVLNLTAQNYDTTSTMAELTAQSGKIVPPGSQAHIVYANQALLTAAITHHELGGAKDVSTISNLATYTGVSHGQGPHVVNGKQAPIV